MIGEWIFKTCEERLRARHSRGGVGLTPVKNRKRGHSAVSGVCGTLPIDCSVLC